MARRTTIEIDEGLLERAKRALGGKTTRATVEEALLRASVAAEGQRADRAARESGYLARLTGRIDAEVLSSEEMWR
jgi:Arc/MetJ family transcription regulator